MPSLRSKAQPKPTSAAQSQPSTSSSRHGPSQQQPPSSSSSRPNSRQGPSQQPSSSSSSRPASRQGQGPSQSQPASSSSRPASRQGQGSSQPNSSSSRPASRQGQGSSQQPASSSSSRPTSRQGVPIKQSPGPSTSSKDKDSRKVNRDQELAVLRSHEEVLKNGILYLICNTGNKIPIKKSEFIKRVFGSDKSSATVHMLMKRIKRVLKDEYGYRIWGFNDGTGELTTDITGNVAGFNLWFVISKFKGITRMLNKLKEDDDVDTTEKIKQSVLIVFLTIIYMQNAEYGVEESQLWNTLTELKFNEGLDLAEKDFKKFMKTEFLGPMYLKVEEQRNEQQGVSTTKYTWGARAHLEIDKWTIFKHAIRQFPGAKPGDFPAQLQAILNSEESSIARKEMKNWERHANESDSSAAASDTDAEKDDMSDQDAPAPSQKNGVIQDTSDSDQDEAPAQKNGVIQDTSDSDQDEAPAQNRVEHDTSASDNEPDLPASERETQPYHHEGSDSDPATTTADESEFD